MGDLLVGIMLMFSAVFFVGFFINNKFLGWGSLFFHLLLLTVGVLFLLDTVERSKLPLPVASYVGDDAIYFEEQSRNLSWMLSCGMIAGSILLTVLSVAFLQSHRLVAFEGGDYARAVSAPRDKKGSFTFMGNWFCR